MAMGGPVPKQAEIWEVKIIKEKPVVDGLTYSL